MTTEPTTEEKIAAYTAGWEACRAGQASKSNPHGFAFDNAKNCWVDPLTHFWELGWLNGQPGLRGQGPGSYAMELRGEWR